MLEHTKPTGTRRAGRLLRSPTARFAAGRIVPAALTFGAAPIIARGLGAGGYGDLALALAIGAAVSAALFGWIEPLLLRELSGADRRHLRRTTLRPVAGSAAGLALTAGALASVASAVLLEPLIAAVAAASIGAGLVTAFTGYARARGHAGTFVAVAIVGSGGRSIGGMAAVALGLGVTGYFWGWFVFCCAAIASGVLLSSYKVRDFLPRVPRRSELWYAAPISGVALSILLLQVVDRIVLRAYVSSEALGVYALGYALVEAGVVLSFSVLHARRFSVLVETWNSGDLSRAELLLRQNIRATTAIPLALLPLFYFQGRQLLETIGGSEFGAYSAAFMVWVVVGLTLYGAAQWVSVSLQFARRTRAWLSAAAIGVLVNIGSIAILGGSLGLQAGGVATFTAYLAMCVATLALSPDGFVLRATIRAASVPITASACAMVVGIATQQLTDALVATLAATATYGAALASIRHRPLGPPNLKDDAQSSGPPETLSHGPERGSPTPPQKRRTVGS